MTVVLSRDWERGQARYFYSPLQVIGVSEKGAYI